MSIDLKNILKNCCKGDIHAQEILYKTFYQYGMSIAVRYAHHVEYAGDILNDSFLKVFMKIRNFQPDGNFKAWFRKIIIHTAIDHYRKEFKNTSTDDPYFNAEPVCRNVILDDLEAGDLMKLIHGLPHLQRVVFSLYELEGFHHEEISRMLDIGVGTSRSCLSRAKNKLRKLITKIYELQEKAG